MHVATAAGRSPCEDVQHAAVHTAPAPAQCRRLPVKQEGHVAGCQAAVNQVSTVLQGKRSSGLSGTASPVALGKGFPAAAMWAADKGALALKLHQTQTDCSGVSDRQRITAHGAEAAPRYTGIHGACSESGAP